MVSPDAADTLAYEIADKSLSLRVDPSAHPLTALYGAAYVFLDRCFVFLGKVGGDVRVTLIPSRGEATQDKLRELGDELVSELVSCTWRAAILAESRDLVQSASGRANSGVSGEPSLDDLQSYEFGEGGNAFDDPLGIATSWEEKYAKKKAAAESADPPTKEKEGP